jgi:hypothetical protein
MDKFKPQDKKIKVSIICPKCRGKMLEGPRYRETIEVSCLICGYRVEPLLQTWNDNKRKVYNRLSNERSRKASK